MTIKPLDTTQARYAQNRAALEQEALDAAKKTDLTALKEVVFSVQGEIGAAARQLVETAAEITSSGPVRDRMLAAGTDDLEKQISRMQTKMGRVLDSASGESVFVRAAGLLADLRDAVREENPRDIARALVKAVLVRNVSYGEWQSLLGKMKEIKDASGDLTHLTNRDAKRALVSDLVKLFYEPLLSALNNPA